MSRTPWVWAVLAMILVLLMAAVLGVAAGWGRGDGWGMMGPGSMGGYWGMSILGPACVLLLGGLFIGGVVWFIQSLVRGGGEMGARKPVGETPLDILKRRYASGEITPEQFEEMWRTLNT